MTRKPNSDGVVETDRKREEALYNYRMQNLESGMREITGAKAPSLINVPRASVDPKIDKYLGDISFMSQEEIDNKRYENQTALQTVGRAAVNFGAITASTLLDATIGNIANIFYGSWDNAISRAFNSISESSQERNKIYRPSGYEEMNIWRQMGTSTFWGDLIQNAGFTTGMMAAGTLGSLVGGPAGLMVAITGIASAFAEARTEGLGAKDDYVDEYSSLLNNEYYKRLQSVKTPEEKTLLDKWFVDKYREITEDATQVGNAVFGTNAALLSLSNIAGWGPILKRGFKPTKGFMNKFFKTRATSTATGEILEEGVDKLADVALKKSTPKWLARTEKVAKGIGSASMEAGEEISQGLIQDMALKQPSVADFTLNEEDEDRLYVADSFVNTFLQVAKEAFNDNNTVLEGVMGAFTSLLGVPGFKTRTTKSGKTRPGLTWSGQWREIIQDIKQDNRERAFLESVNKSLASGKIDRLVRNYGRTSSFARNKQIAAAIDDKFNFDNYDLAELISTIVTFDSIGRMDLLEGYVDRARNFTDEELTSLAQTLKTESGIDTFIKSDGTVDLQAMREKIGENTDRLNDYIALYRELLETLDATEIGLDNKIKSQYIYAVSQIKDWERRRNTIEQEIREAVGNQDISKWTMGDAPLSFITLLVENKEFRDIVKERLRKDLSMDPVKINEYLKKIDDLAKIDKGIKEFNLKLKEMYEDTQSYGERIVDEEIKRRFEVRMKQARESASKVIRNLIDSDNTVSDYVRYIYSDADQTEKDAVNEMLRQRHEEYEKTQEDNDEAVLFDEYSSAIEYLRRVMAIMDSIGESDPLNRLLRIIHDGKLNADNAINFKTAVNDAIKGELSPENYEKYEKALEEFDKAERILNSQGGKKKGILSTIMEEEEETEEETVEEEEDETEEEEEEFVDEESDDDEEILEEERKKEKKPKRKPIKKKRESTEEIEEVDGFKQTNREKELEKISQGSSGNNSEDAYAAGRQQSAYDLEALKEHKMISSSEDNWGVRIMKAAGLDRFLEKGYLWEYITSRRKEKLPLTVNYVILGSNKENSNYYWPSRKTIFAAIPSKHGNVTVYNSAGKAVKMQILGVVSSTKDDSSSENFKTFKKAAFEEYNNSVQRDYVLSATSVLEFAFSGRFVTSDATSEKQDRNLLDIMPRKEDSKGRKTSEIDTSNVQIVIYSDDKEHTIGNKLDGVIVPLNANNRNKRRGVVWLRVREGNGQIFHKYVRVKTFSKEEYDLEDPIHSGSPVVSKIKELCNIISTNYENTAARNAALSELHKYIQFPEKTLIITSNGQAKIDRGQIDLSEQDALFNFIYDQGFKFNIGRGRLSLEEIINSDILATDLLSIYNKGASFLISETVYNEEDGSYENRSSKVAANINVHTGNRAFQEGKNSAYTNIDGTTYIKTDDGKYYIHKNGKPKEIHSLREKAVIDLYLDIQAGLVRTNKYWVSSQGKFSLYSIQDPENPAATILVAKTRSGSHDSLHVLTEKEMREHLRTVRKERNKKEDNTVTYKVGRKNIPARYFGKTLYRQATEFFGYLYEVGGRPGVRLFKEEKKDKILLYRVVRPSTNTEYANDPSLFYMVPNYAAKEVLKSIFNGTDGIDMFYDMKGEPAVGKIPKIVKAAVLLITDDQVSLHEKGIIEWVDIPTEVEESTKKSTTRKTEKTANTETKTPEEENVEENAEEVNEKDDNKGIRKNRRTKSGTGVIRRKKENIKNGSPEYYIATRLNSDAMKESVNINTFLENIPNIDKSKSFVDILTDILQKYSLKDSVESMQEKGCSVKEILDYIENQVSCK